MPIVRALVFPLSAAPPFPLSPSSETTLPGSIRSLLYEFRLLTNQCLRQALLINKTSRGALSRFARDRADEAHVNGKIGLQAADIALAIAAGHRRRLRQGLHPRIPYVRTPFLRAPTPAFHFNPESGKLRVSLRRCEWASLTVPVSNYHRRVLATPGLRVKQLHLGLRRLVLIYEKEAPDPYAPTSLVVLDTNESSLDGVRVDEEGAQLVRVSFPELRAIQGRHFSRRRFLGHKKAHDRRVARRLLRREGWRERHRVRSRLHYLTRQLIERSARDHSALALEDLSRLPTSRVRSRAIRRRLSSWPRGELHRQLAYKAAERGVPVYWVNPYRSSRTCPRCGAVTEHRRRVGPRFDCGQCGWSMDRQLNAGVNLGLTVLREHAELGGLRLAPDALLNEVVRPLYPRAKRSGARAERTGREGRSSKVQPRGQSLEEGHSS